MTFINSILTDAEKEMFKEREIPYPKEIFWEKNTFLGCKSRVTIDRKDKVYLFNCGQHPGVDEMDDFHFSLVWDDILGNSQVSFHLIREFKYSKTNDNEYIFWKLLKVNLPNNIGINKKVLCEKLKEALIVYGLDGDPQFTNCYVVKFNF